jgi:hypothetical protein
MVAAEWIQSGLASGANETFACGRYEFPIRLFHDAVDRAVAASRPKEVRPGDPAVR